MNRDDIIELANQLTERKSERVIDLKSLYYFVLQDMCGRTRFYWRLQTATFSTVVGQATYDLTSVLTPQVSDIAVEEITHVGLVNSATPNSVDDLSPVFDPFTIIEMREGTSQNIKPGRYAAADSDYKTLLLDPPDLIYKMRISFWAMPNPGTDDAVSAVPLVPPYYHKNIVSGMCQYIWETVYGMSDPRSIQMKQRYEDGIIEMQRKRRFSPFNAVTLTTGETSIQSSVSGLSSTGPTSPG